MSLHFPAIFSCLLLSLLLNLPLSSASAAEAESSEQVDYLALAAVMIRDGRFPRALDALRKVSPEDEDVEAKRFYTLRGLARLNAEQYPGAVSDLKAAMAEGEENVSLHYYLARAYFHTEEYPSALREIAQSKSLLEPRPGLWLLEAEIRWKSGDRSAAWNTLSAASKQFPDDSSIGRRRVFMLIELGLYRQAATLGLELFDSETGQLADYLAVGKALSQSGQREEALRFLEIARIRFPDNRDAALALAAVYAEQDHYYAAAGVVDRIAIAEPAIASDAAELHRRAKGLAGALEMNARSPDQKKKLKQRLALLLDGGLFEAATAMEPALLRQGLEADEDIAYALAYANFKTGEYDAAERYLKDISRPELFRKATDLRKAMDSCHVNRWLCY